MTKTQRWLLSIVITAIITAIISAILAANIIQIGWHNVITVVHNYQTIQQPTPIQVITQSPDPPTPQTKTPEPTPKSDKEKPSKISRVKDSRAGRNQESNHPRYIPVQDSDTPKLIAVQQPRGRILIPIQQPVGNRACDNIIGQGNRKIIIRQ
ncbi:MAG TPA: hypothetical protein VE732_06415 [Nitrososphaera sp.]|jgi:hypothetical protein|nr:hypothetical protein [Nitrososphaera sp.]